MTLFCYIFTGCSTPPLLFFFGSGRRKSARAKNRPFWPSRVKTDDSSRFLLSNLGLELHFATHYAADFAIIAENPSLVTCIFHFMK